MKLLRALCVLLTLATLMIGCADDEPAAEIPPAKILNFVDAGPAQEVRAGERFRVEGTFRIPGGVESGPLPTIIKVRDGNNIVHGSISVFPELRGEDEYAFSGDIDTVAQPGDFTIEVNVRGQPVQTQDLKVVR